MEEIKVEEYVRLKDGIILKYGEKSSTIIENNIYTDYSGEYEWSSEVVKHSPNIIDLIEVDDICIIDDKLSGFDCVYIYDESFIEAVKEDARRGYKIKSILTKELYEQNCYKLEE